MAPARTPERGSHSSGTMLAHRLAQPTRMIGPETGCRRFWRPASSLFGLAPGGVYLAAAVTRGAVGSYPTLSPLPRIKRGGLLSVALSLGAPPPDVIRHRVSVEPGLSSPYRLSALVKRGCPANWHRLNRRFDPQRPQRETKNSPNDMKCKALRPIFGIKTSTTANHQNINGYVRP